MKKTCFTDTLQLFAISILIFTMNPAITMAEDVRGNKVDLGSNAIIQKVYGGVFKYKNNLGHATLLFPQGIEAMLTFHDSSKKTLESMMVLETEHALDYTRYEADSEKVLFYFKLDISEAIQSGAESITFNKPVVCYMEGFPAIPVGTKIDAVYKGKITGNVETMGTGIVVRVLGIRDGKAELDVDGGGRPADYIALDSLGITEEELKSLADWSQKDQTLWRFRISNFMF